MGKGAQTLAPAQCPRVTHGPLGHVHFLPEVTLCQFLAGEETRLHTTPDAATQTPRAALGKPDH